MEENKNWKDVKVTLGGKELKDVKSLSYNSEELKDVKSESIYSSSALPRRRREFTNKLRQVIKFDVYGAHLAGANEHPQRVVESLGMKVVAYESVTIADCIMMLVEGLPEELPSYIEKSDHKMAVEPDDE